jgi:hypothetical protein
MCVSLAPRRVKCTAGASIPRRCATCTRYWCGHPSPRPSSSPSARRSLSVTRPSSLAPLRSLTHGCGSSVRLGSAQVPALLHTLGECVCAQGSSFSYNGYDFFPVKKPQLWIRKDGDSTVERERIIQGYSYLVNSFFSVIVETRYRREVRSLSCARRPAAPASWFAMLAGSIRDVQRHESIRDVARSAAEAVAGPGGPRDTQHRQRRRRTADPPANRQLHHKGGVVLCGPRADVPHH